MTSNQTSPNFTRRSTFSRVLSLLLLILIVYGTTVEAAHRHGGQAPGKQFSGVTLSASGAARAPGVNLFGCGDCLICQLHQNFSTSLITIRSGQLTLAPRAQYSETDTMVVQSRRNAPRTGRAPPKPFLS